MEIGQHFLEGSIVGLKKPFLVIDKLAKNENGAKLEIIGYAKKKIIFNTRPKPLGLKKLKHTE